jgi:hypothetical protein
MGGCAAAGRRGDGGPDVGARIADPKSIPRSRVVSGQDGTKKSPDVETTGLRYLDLISVVDWMIKIYLESNS